MGVTLEQEIRGTINVITVCDARHRDVTDETVIFVNGVMLRTLSSSHCGFFDASAAGTEFPMREFAVLDCRWLVLWFAEGAIRASKAVPKVVIDA